MKKNSTLLIITAVLFCSCQKADEYLSEDSSNANFQKTGYLENKPNAEINSCQILQISYSVGNGSDVLQFSYNSAGDPISVTRPLPATGYPNFTFQYDNKNRLTDFIGPYGGNTNAEFWHKYFYDNQGNIILDSAYIFPRIANGFPENAFSKQLTFYTYDNKRRIIKDSTVFSAGTNSVVHNYSYDNNGNRTGNSYDDKVNVNRTNKIWMFLNRDYSVNNPLKADSYTDAGLPLNFSSSSAESSFKFLGNSYSNVQINYDCTKRN